MKMLNWHNETFYLKLYLRFDRWKRLESFHACLPKNFETFRNNQSQNPLKNSSRFHRSKRR